MLDIPTYFVSAYTAQQIEDSISKIVNNEVVLPSVTAADAGKIMMVNDAGKWVATALANGDEEAY